MHEECGPWVLSLILPVYFSLISQSTTPIMCSAIPELVFFGFICAKLMFLFDRPNKPQPLLDTRSWEDVVENIWASQSTLEKKLARCFKSAVHPVQISRRGFAKPGAVFCRAFMRQKLTNISTKTA